MIRPIELQATLSQIFLQKQIVTVSCEEIEWCEKYNDDFIDTYFPIPVTEDRLHEMGFHCLGKKRNWFDKTLINGMEISLSIEGTFAIMIKGEYINLKTGLQYIHQVQQIVYILSEECLKITN